MISAEIIKTQGYGRNLSLILPLRYAIVKVVLQVLQFFVSLDIDVTFKTHDMGLYLINEHIAFN